MNEQRGVTVEGLVHWALPVNDLEESRRFYTEILGMADGGPVGPTMRCVRFGATDILLCKRPQPGAADQPRESQVHIAFRVSPQDFDRAAANMRAWGVAVKPPSGPAETIKGDVEHRTDGVFIGRSLYFNDPSGNRLELHDPARRG
jgi:catechol 2,3-dioxygenase-like lactoylglutathione lyase family enzyme